MSLVEATIILMVISLLTAVLAPSIGDYVSEARHTKAKEDVEAIGTAIMRLARDIGPCFKFTPADPCTMDNRVDILHSEGPDVGGNDFSATATNFTSTDNISNDAINWNNDASALIGDSMMDQLVNNVPDYNTPADTTPTGYTITGPNAGLGWRGAYIGSEIGPDPWGRRYLATTVFLAVATDAVDGTAEGNRRGGWSHDSVVISGGSNQLFDTPIGGSANFGAGRIGDDLLYVVSGDSR
jgi:type II secretory pathway pseudopilin PulG